ncbi:pyruvate formate-lyase-activating protein [Luedemannella flava]|uniref:Pyruvate formate-lyase-activating enzyme n=1 Tax=Luedemannella flava TaxID=349316 RepID=A0ABN2M9K1_9ACTN
MAPSDLEVTGSVHSWDISIGVDGPGVRFAAFLAGCPLKCRYCHSPDTQTMRSGTRRSVGDLMAEIEQYEDFIGTNGGVTVTGGEPLLQPRFAGALLRMCKQNGLHTALDTSGYLGARADDALLDATDLVLLDVKSWGEARYRELTGRPLAPTLRFARRLADRGMPMWIRFVLVPGLTDGPEVVEGVAGFVAGLPTVERVEVLPFHRLGATKYAELGIEFPLRHTEPPDEELIAGTRDRFAAHGLLVA